jgi:plasmid stabilization system protein ParE
VYEIHYLPLALNDLKDITQYIAFKLDAPQAAERFLSKLDKEVLKIADNPFRCHAYTPPEKLKSTGSSTHGEIYRILKEQKTP